MLKQIIQIVFSHSRERRPVSDIVEELSDSITRNSPFPGVLQNAEALVGSRIKHRFETNDEMKWYIVGGVVSFNGRTKKHEVAYYGEKDQFFDLSIDIANSKQIE